MKNIKEILRLSSDTILSPEPKLPMFGFFKINFVLYLICVTWVIILIITPLLEDPGTITYDDNGLVSRDEHFYQIESYTNPFVRVVYHSGDYMCHQKSSRSFIICDNQMSYCARCFGIFLGMAIGAAISTFVWIEMKWWLVVGGLIPIGLDGGLQLITVYESNNIFRILTGSLMGIVTMITVGLVVIELSQAIKLWLSKKKYERLNKDQAKNYNKSN